MMLLWLILPTGFSDGSPVTLRGQEKVGSHSTRACVNKNIALLFENSGSEISTVVRHYMTFLLIF